MKMKFMKTKLMMTKLMKAFSDFSLSRRLAGLAGFFLLAMAMALAVVPALALAGNSFDPGRGLVELQVTINGYLSGTFGLDTGADEFYLDRSFAERAGVIVTPIAGAEVVRGVNGESGVARAIVRSLAVGDERIYNIPALVIDIAALTSGADHRLDGLIGYAALSRYYVTIDYPGRNIELFTHEPNFDLDKVLGVPFEMQGHLIVVTASVSGSEPMRFFLDYCASSTIIVPRALEKMGFSPAVASAPNETARIADSITVGPITSVGVSYYSQSLNSLASSPTFRNIDGILGYSFLKDYHITIDYRRQLLLFHRD